MQTISWNLKAPCSVKEHFTRTFTHTYTCEVYSASMGHLGSTRNTKTQDNKSVASSKIGHSGQKWSISISDVFICACVHVCICAFGERIWYLACNSSLQIPAATSGLVCGYPRLPWAQSSNTPSHSCLPRRSHLLVIQSPEFIFAMYISIHIRLVLWWFQKGSLKQSTKHVISIFFMRMFDFIIVVISM